MTDDEIGFMAYWFARRSSQRRRRSVRTTPSKRYPSMPKREWRLWALACVVVGAVVGGGLFALLTWPPLGGAVVGALTTFVVGMIQIETRWARRHPEAQPAAR